MKESIEHHLEVLTEAARLAAEAAEELSAAVQGGSDDVEYLNARVQALTGLCGEKASLVARISNDGAELEQAKPVPNDQHFRYNGENAHHPPRSRAGSDRNLS